MKKNSIEVFPCGIMIKFYLEHGEQKGIITGVSIRPDGVRYEVSCFVNNDYQTKWLYEFEFILVISVEKEKIGYK